MIAIPRWFDRKFDFSVPVEIYPNMLVRLIGTPARLRDLVSHAPHEILVAKQGAGWSPQEHAGHLLDLEPLWMARVEDFLNGARALTAADLNNRKTDQAHHNSRELSQILLGFQLERTWLIDRIAPLKVSVFERTLEHPRLKQPMRLVDHLFFIAEHDDHHLAAIWAQLAPAGQVSPTPNP